MVGQAHGDTSVARGHVDIVVSRGHMGGFRLQGQGHHFLATAVPREEGPGQVKMCHISYLRAREQPRAPGGGLPTPKSVPAVTPQGSSRTGSRALLSSRAEHLQGNAHPPPEPPGWPREAVRVAHVASPCTGAQGVPR